MKLFSAFSFLSLSLFLKKARTESAIQQLKTEASHVQDLAETEFNGMMKHINELREEVSKTIYKLSTEMSPKIKLSRRDQLMFDHVLESLKQAEQSAIHALDRSIKTPTLNIGPLTKYRVHYEISSTVLRFIGIFGLAVIVGNTIHYLVWGFLATGSLLVTFVSLVPLLFASITIFPPVLQFVEGFLGMSYVTALFSYFGMSQLLETVEYTLHSSALLEIIGILVIISAVTALTTNFMDLALSYYLREETKMGDMKGTSINADGSPTSVSTTPNPTSPAAAKKMAHKSPLEKEGVKN